MIIACEGAQALSFGSSVTMYQIVLVATAVDYMTPTHSRLTTTGGAPQTICGLNKMG